MRNALRHIFGPGVIIVAIGLAAPSTSWAESASAARTDLADSNLQPAPLFPTSIPGVVRRARFTVTLTGNGMYNVGFARCCGSGGILLLAGGIIREPYSLLQGEIRAIREQGNRVTKHRMRGRTVYFWRGLSEMSYGWHEQGFTYIVGSHYTGGITQQDLATMVRSMSPV
jgi:hypothetical protein